MTEELNVLKRLSTLIMADESDEECEGLETPKANQKPAISKKQEDHGFFGNLVEGLDTHQQLLAGVQDLCIDDSDHEEDTPTESNATNTSVEEVETKNVDKDKAEEKLGKTQKLQSARAKQIEDLMENENIDHSAIEDVDQLGMLELEEVDQIVNMADNLAFKLTR